MEKMYLFNTYDYPTDDKGLCNYDINNFYWAESVTYCNEISKELDLENMQKTKIR